MTHLNFIKILRALLQHSKMDRYLTTLQHIMVYRIPWTSKQSMYLFHCELSISFISIQMRVASQQRIYCLRMSNQRLTLVRLEKQERCLLNEPVPHLIVKRKGLLDFHFCIHGLDGPYEGGFYHGVLQLPSDYPFSPPQLKFFTESGRFETNKPICTTFTNFHRQQWTSAWNVRSMLVGLLSFMTSNQGGTGCLRESDQKKRALAQKSLERNMASPQFVSLFKDSLEQLKVKTQYYTPKRQQKQSDIKQNAATKPQPPKPQRQAENSSAMYILIGLLIILFMVYGFLRNDINRWLTGASSEN